MRQLDELYPHLRTTRPCPGPTGTIEAPVEHLDLATVIKVSQAVSGEIVLEKLLDTLMRTAHRARGRCARSVAAAARGGARIAAEATTSGDTVIVRLREASVARPRYRSRSSTMSCARARASSSTMPQCRNPFSTDPYLRQRRARSLLCVPLITRPNSSGPSTSKTI